MNKNTILKLAAATLFSGVSVYRARRFDVSVPHV